MAVNTKMNPALLKLQKNLEQTVAKTNTQATVNLPISSLDWNPDNEFIFGMEGISQFAEILKGKFKGAIVVFDKGEIDGVHRYEIGSGHRRAEAKKLAGDSTILCIVLPMPNDVEKAEFLIDSNIQNRTLTPINYARAFAHLKKVYDAENNKLKAEKKRPENVMEKIATRYNMSRMNVARYLALNNLLPEIQELVSDNVVSWTGLYPVTSWTEEEQKRLHFLIKEKLHEVSADYTDEEEKTIRLTSSMLKGLITQVEGKAEIPETKEETNADKTPSSNKKVDFHTYFTKLSGQIEKLIDLPDEEIDEFDVDDLTSAIQKIRESLDKLDVKISESKK